MSLYLCDPEKNKTCNKKNCFGYGGPCFITLTSAFSASGEALTDKDISTIAKFYEMRLKYEKKRMQRKLRRKAAENES